MADYRQDKGRFKYHNENPRGLKRAGDCVVRALAKGLEKDWETVYQGLALLGLELKDMPSADRVYEEYLKLDGFEKQKQPRKANNLKYTVEEFAAENPIGTYIVRIAGHLTVINKGFIYDTWNCSYKSVGNYWEIR